MARLHARLGHVEGAMHEHARQEEEIDDTVTGPLALEDAWRRHVVEEQERHQCTQDLITAARRRPRRSRPLHRAGLEHASRGALPGPAFERGGRDVIRRATIALCVAVTAIAWIVRHEIQ